MPDLTNRFLFWRAVRLAFALALPGVIATQFGLSNPQAFVLFFSMLYLTLTDMSGAVLNRIGMMTLILVNNIIIGIITIYLSEVWWAVALLIVAVTIWGVIGARVLPAKNMFTSLSILALIFALPFSWDRISLTHYVQFQMLGGAVYMSMVVVGFAIHYGLCRVNNQWANYFFLDENFKVADRFFTPSSQVAEIVASEREGESKLIFRHPFRLGVSLLLGYGYILAFPSTQAYWVLLTILFVHHPSKWFNASLPRMMQRFIGSIMGLILFWPLVYITLPTYGWITLSFLFSIPIFLFVRDNYFIAITFITLLVMTVISLYNLMSLEVLLERALDTFIGITIVIASHFLIFGLRKVAQQPTVW